MEFVIKQLALRIIKASLRSLLTWITVKFQYCIWQRFICIYPQMQRCLVFHVEDPHHADSDVYMPESDKV